MQEVYPVSLKLYEMYGDLPPNSAFLQYSSYLHPWAHIMSFIVAAGKHFYSNLLISPYKRT